MPKLVEGYADRIKVPDGARDVLVFDNGHDKAVRGFGIRKFASGRAFYIVKYSYRGQPRRHSLGEVRRGNLEKMRELAEDVKARARLGQDLVTEKATKAAADRAAKTAVAIGVLVPIYLKEREDDLSDKSHHETTRYLKASCAGLHHLVIGAVTRGDQTGVVDIDKRWTPINGHKLEIVARSHVVEMIDDMAEASGKVAADRAKTALSTFFGWAIDRGYCDINPTLNIKARAGNGSRKRALTEPELVEVWNACSDGSEYSRIIRLLILTGQRRAEIGDLSWPEIDFDKRQIELPASRTKNGLDHIVPLSNEALAILEAVPESEHRSFVFGIGAGGYGGWSKSKSELDERIAEARAKAGMDDMDPWVVHDLRRTVVTGLGESRERKNDKGEVETYSFAQPHVIEAVVNHVSGHKAGVAGTYNKAQYLPERRQALELWGAHVAGLVARPLRPKQRVKAKKLRERARSGAGVTAV
jgi:integrase